MIVELCIDGHVILRVHIWYLVLSAILRNETGLLDSENWRDAELFLCEPGQSDREGTLLYEHRIMVPQPPEFREDT
jgi:hypothetical protein